MTIDINELRRLAQEAMHPLTKGRWMRLFGERIVYDRMEDGCRGIPVVSTPFSPPHPFEAACLDFIAAANPATISELLDRLEAAESALSNLGVTPDEARDGLARHKALIARLEAAEKERDALRAKVAEMERQEPVAWCGRGPRDGRIELSVHKPAPSVMRDFAVTPLYALPGAQTQGDEK